MPGWGELLKELNAEIAGLPPDQAGPALDAKRVGYLKAMHDRTGRPVFLYATNWLGGGAPPDLTSISLVDIHGLMEVSRDVDGPGLEYSTCRDLCSGLSTSLRKPAVLGCSSHPSKSASST